MTDRSSRGDLARQDADFVPEHYRHEDEISLYDLFDVLVRRWAVIAAVFVAIVGLGAFKAFSSVPAYTFRSGVQLGQVHSGEQSRLIETSDEARARLEDSIIPELRRALQAAGEPAPRVRAESGSANSRVRLATVAPAAERPAVEALHTAIAEALAAEQAARYEETFELASERVRLQLEQLQSDAAAVREQMELMGQRRDGVGEADVTLVALIDAQRFSDLRRELNQLRGEMARVRADLNTVERLSRPTQLSFVATQSESPVGSGKGLILALAGVLGLMVGVFAAFLWEFVANARRRRAA